MTVLTRISQMSDILTQFIAQHKGLGRKIHKGLGMSDLNTFCDNFETNRSTGLNCDAMWVPKEVTSDVDFNSLLPLLLKLLTFLWF